MNELQLELTRLLGKKELTFGCWLFIENPDGYAQFIEESVVGKGFTIMSATDGYSILNEVKDNFKEYTVIGHPATLTDLHRWMNDNGKLTPRFEQVGFSIRFIVEPKWIVIDYDSNKELLDQSEETLSQIISLIKSNR